MAAGAFGRARNYGWDGVLVVKWRHHVNVLLVLQNDQHVFLIGPCCTVFICFLLFFLRCWNSRMSNFSTVLRLDHAPVLDAISWDCWTYILLTQWSGGWGAELRECRGVSSYGALGISKGFFDERKSEGQKPNRWVKCTLPCIVMSIVNAFASIKVTLSNDTCSSRKLNFILRKHNSDARLSLFCGMLLGSSDDSLTQSLLFWMFAI